MSLYPYTSKFQAVCVFIILQRVCPRGTKAAGIQVSSRGHCIFQNMPGPPGQLMGAVSGMSMAKSLRGFLRAGVHGSPSNFKAALVNGIGAVPEGGSQGSLRGVLRAGVHGLPSNFKAALVKGAGHPGWWSSCLHRPHLCRSLRSPGWGKGGSHWH